MPQSVFLVALIFFDFAHLRMGIDIKITHANTMAINVLDIWPYKNAKTAMHGIAGTDIARKTSKPKSFRFKNAREAWLINNEILMMGTIGATPTIGAIAADSKNPPATPVAPCNVEVKKAIKPMSIIVSLL